MPRGVACYATKRDAFFALPSQCSCAAAVVDGLEMTAVEVKNCGALLVLLCALHALKSSAQHAHRGQSHRVLSDGQATQPEVSNADRIVVVSEPQPWCTLR
ncbi:hypothetical protein Q4I32_008106 [Leishmania shawi]|uniref:Secreted protein n=1 Tax=Leishmania shawi TaxID=5680 RepID=A0AAW3B4R0_9TRYP